MPSCGLHVATLAALGGPGGKAVCCGNEPCRGVEDREVDTEMLRGVDVEGGRRMLDPDAEVCVPEGEVECTDSRPGSGGRAPVLRQSPPLG